MTSKNIKPYLIGLGLSIFFLFLYIFYDYIFAFNAIFDRTIKGVCDSIARGYATDIIIASISIIGFLIARPVGYTLTLLLPFWGLLWFVFINNQFISSNFGYLALALIIVLATLPKAIREYYGIADFKSLGIYLSISIGLTLIVFWINELLFTT